jgi:two-component system chemotaxis response regulator CheY
MIKPIRSATADTLDGVKAIMRFLIAEDDPIGARILELLLKPYGQSVKALDGEEALTQFKGAHQAQEPFRLLFLDIVMPKKLGMEVLSDVRAYEREHKISSENQVKVIMLTGQADLNNINKAQVLGISNYLIKPFEEDQLLRGLQHLGIIEDPNDSWR